MDFIKRLSNKQLLTNICKVRQTGMLPDGPYSIEEHIRELYSRNPEAELYREEGVTVSDLMKELGQIPLDDEDPKIHALKILPEYFKPILEGCKRSETRVNDRDFQIGDILILCEYDSERKVFTDNQINVEITHICDYQQINNNVVLSFEMLSQNYSNVSEYDQLI